VGIHAPPSDFGVTSRKALGYILPGYFRRWSTRTSTCVSIDKLLRCTVFDMSLHIIKIAANVACRLSIGLSIKGVAQNLQISGLLGHCSKPSTGPKVLLIIVEKLVDMSMTSIACWVLLVFQVALSLFTARSSPQSRIIIEKTHSHAVYIQEATRDIYGIADTTRAVAVLVYLFE
jgi:hypothetical protein